MILTLKQKGMEEGLIHSVIMWQQAYATISKWTWIMLPGF